jgi:hypothetical protein
MVAAVNVVRAMALAILTATIATGAVEIAIVLVALEVILWRQFELIVHAGDTAAR